MYHGLLKIPFRILNITVKVYKFDIEMHFARLHYFSDLILTLLLDFNHTSHLSDGIAMYHCADWSYKGTTPYVKSLDLMHTCHHVYRQG